MKRIFLFVVAALCVFLTSCEKGNGGSTGGKAKYTVIMYANGGGDIDEYLEEDIANGAEVISKRINEGIVRLVVCMKYSPQAGLDLQKDEVYDEEGREYIPGGKASSVYLYEAGPECLNFRTQEGVLQVLSLPDSCIAQGSQFRMFKPANIAQVLKKAAKMAPAENYILLVAGHANGWDVSTDGEYPSPNKKAASAAADPHFKGRAIKAKELHDGIVQSGVRISGIIFDCCMMNNIEYLSELVDVTDYTLASGHSTKGSKVGKFVENLYAARNLEEALKLQARDNTRYHMELYEESSDPDPVDMNVEYAVVKMSAMPAVWNGLKSMVDYLCANMKDSASYTVASQKCYQYFNNSTKYDIMDYFALLKAEGGPYLNDEGYNKVYKALDGAISGAIVAHEYGNHFTQGYKPAHALTMSINLGAKGRFVPNPQLYDEETSCKAYDYTGQMWSFTPSYKAGDKEIWSIGREKNPSYNWDYSYKLSVIEQKTGWTKWLKANPVTPFGNPPYDDEGDTDGMGDSSDDEEGEDGDEELRD